MANYIFSEAFSHSGAYYAPGQTYELPPETVAALPPGIAEPTGGIEFQVAGSDETPDLTSDPVKTGAKTKAPSTKAGIKGDTPPPPPEE